MATIETKHYVLQNKIDILRDIFPLYLIEKQDVPDAKANSLYARFEEYIAYYYQGATPILTKYFEFSEKFRKFKNKRKFMESEKFEKLLTIHRKEKSKFFAEYSSFLSISNMAYKLSILANTIMGKTEDLVIKSQLDLFNKNTIVNKVQTTDYEICDKCRSKLRIDISKSQMICDKCAIIKTINGVSFENENQQNELNKNKCRSYDPWKHFRFWMDRLQAREPTEIPESVIQRLKNRIKLDDLIMSKLSCKLLRVYLREIKCTKYNDHIPKIRMIITGIPAPKLYPLEMRLISLYFNQIIRIYYEIKPDDKINTPYHPYFLYKIIEQVINKEKDQDRKRELLSGIHLQSRNTLMENDLIMKKICKKLKIPGFNYIPTNRNIIG